MNKPRKMSGIMNDKVFNNPDIWCGSHYELSIEFQNDGNNEKLNKALEILSKSRFFTGMWNERADYLRKSVSLPLNFEDDSVTQFYGILSLSNESKLPNVISVIRVKDESDWITIAIPSAWLEERYLVNYPLIKAENDWLNNIDEMYIALAEMIFKSSPFKLAIIGEEISGITNHVEISEKFVNNHICLLPPELQIQLNLHQQGKELSNQLRIFD